MSYYAKPWKPVGMTSIETHDGEIMLTCHGGNYVNEHVRQLICDGINAMEYHTPLTADTEGKSDGR